MILCALESILCNFYGFSEKIIYFMTFYYVWDYREFHRQDTEETWGWPLLALL